MSANLYLCPIAAVLQYFTDQGIVLAGGSIYTFVAASDIPIVTFTDITGIVQNSNPIILDGAGRLPGVSIWQTEGIAIKIVIKDANNNVVGNTLDQILGINDPISTSTSISSVVTQSYIGTTLYPITLAEQVAGVFSVPNPFYPPGNALRYGVDPTGATDTTVNMQTWVDAAWSMYSSGFLDNQGLWNGTGGANPVLVLPPGKYQITNTVYLPSGITFKGTGHPANTVSHTRIILNSTGTTPVRTWSANTPFAFFNSVNPGTGTGTFYFTATTAGVSGSVTPPWTSAQTNGATITDGTVVWTAQAPMTAGDNRNNPMFKFRRGTLPPSSGNGVLQNSGGTAAIQELEFWCVTWGVSTFSNPLAGIGLSMGDYPSGGIFSFDVDVADFRFKDCVFQHSPAAIRGVGINANTAFRGDGFPGNRGLSIFFENCEFDSSASHFYIQNCYLDLYIEDCEFFGGIHRYEGCTGNVRYQNGDMFGGAYVDAMTVPNSFDRFYVKGVAMIPQINFPQIGVDFSGSSGTNLSVIDVSENTCDGPATIGGFTIIAANSGKISGNVLNDQGFNCPPGTGPSSFVSAIKAVGCQNLLISNNNITATDTSGTVYNGFGILLVDGGVPSTNNFVNGNAVSAPLNGSAFNNQGRFVNITSADIYGQNYESRGTRVVTEQNKNIEGQQVAGSQPVNFSSNNKPGLSNTSPAIWIQEFIDGSVYFSPKWK